jgi:hypothetical protein
MLLVDYIDKTIDVSDFHKLYFVHNLTMSEYECAKGSLDQKPCNNFPDINPIYLFYGKPLFNPCKNFDPVDITTWPICLIIPAESIPIKRAYPFDTGAYLGEPDCAGDDMIRFFKDEDGNQIPICMYNLGTELDTIGRYIYTFFGDNNNYFGSADNWAPECREDIPICGEGKKALVVSKLYDFLRGTLKKLDNRCKVVEIHAVGSHKISDVVIAYVSPYNNDNIRQGMPTNAFPIFYFTETIRTSEHFVNKIAEKVRFYHEQAEII